jgi:hypothetical protein
MTEAGVRFAVLPPFLLAVDPLPPFLPVPLLLSDVISAVMLMWAGPFSRIHLIYLVIMPHFSAAATA